MATMSIPNLETSERPLQFNLQTFWWVFLLVAYGLWLFRSQGMQAIAPLASMCGFHLAMLLLLSREGNDQKLGRGRALTFGWLLFVPLMGAAVFCGVLLAANGAVRGPGGLPATNVPSEIYPFVLIAVVGLLPMTSMFGLWAFLRVWSVRGEAFRSNPKLRTPFLISCWGMFVSHLYLYFLVMLSMWWLGTMF
jgi:hypothetical protein